MTKVNSIRAALTAALVLGLLPFAWGADQITSQERNALITELKESREALVQTVSGLSEEQLHFKTGHFNWSIAQNLGHLAKSEVLLGGLVTQRMMQDLQEGSPQSQEQAAAKPVDLEEMMRWIVAREKRFQSPQRLRAGNEPESSSALLKEFVAERNKLIEFVSTTRQDLHGVTRPNPVLGPLDAYQWLYFASGHTRRHLVQIQEVMSHPDFPR